MPVLVYQGRSLLSSLVPVHKGGFEASLLTFFKAEVQATQAPCSFTIHAPVLLYSCCGLSSRSGEGSADERMGL